MTRKDWKELAGMMLALLVFIAIAAAMAVTWIGGC